ncbi:MAG: hypothetical protein ACYTDW_10740 [Planctomycetota bacterium]|jgi:hypothetical protein
MRTLFIPLAKLLGIYEIFRALSYILFIISGAIRTEKFDNSLVISFSIHAILLILALILIFKAKKIADVLKIPQDTTDSLVFDFHSMLRAGLVLVGITMFVHAIPILFGSALVLIPVPAKEMGHVYARYYQQLYISILEVVFGGCLVLLSNRLTRFLNRYKVGT